MSQRGFTLIEMALVLIIAGILIGGGLLAVGPVLDKARINQTNATMDQVENALVLFVIRNNRLPCPAIGSTLATVPANYGIEQLTGSACTATTVNGVIPWRTLGIDESYSTDGWGNRLSYFAAQGGVAGAGAAATVTAASSVMRNGTTYPTGPFMTVTDAASASPITPTTGNDQAAYVLISHGKSGWYAWNKNGTQRTALVAGGPKACNNDPSASGCSTSFRSGSWVGAYPPTSAAYFDDIVRWRSPAFIIQLCGSGACGN